MDCTLILYGTAACHLCEEALAIILPLASASNITVQSIDIAGNDLLEERYGTRIPVIAYNMKELGWPFNLDQATTFLDITKD